MKKKNILIFIIGAAVGAAVGKTIGYAISENDQWNRFVRDMTKKFSCENCGQTIDKEIEKDFDDKQVEKQQTAVKMP